MPKTSIELLRRIRSQWIATPWLLAIVDQGIIGLGNFCITVLAANILGVQQFGKYVLLWISILAVAGVQTAILTQPMMTIGARVTAKPGYFGYLFRLQLMVGSCVALAMVGGSRILSGFGVIEATDTAAIAMGVALFILGLQDWFRRYFFVSGNARSAVRLDSVGYIATVVLLLALLFLAPEREIAKAAVLMAIAIGTASGLLFSVMQVRHLMVRQDYLRSDVVQHFRLGLWLGASAIPQVFISNCAFFLVGRFAGEVALASFRAIQNLAGLANVLIGAMENAVTLISVRAFAEGGLAALRRSLARSIVCFVAAVGLIELSILLTAPYLITMIYGPEFLSDTWFTLVVAILYVLTAVGVITRIGARVLDRGGMIFTSYVMAAFTIVVSGVPLTKELGAIGAVLGWGLAHVAIIVINVLSIGDGKRRRAPG